MIYDWKAKTNSFKDFVYPKGDMIISIIFAVKIFDVLICYIKRIQIRKINKRLHTKH